MIKPARVALLLSAALSAVPLPAQTFDSSGNGLLSGTYYFRHVIYAISTQADENGVAGDISEAIAVFGNITFDGNGNYSITNGIAADSYVNSQEGAIVQDGLSCYIAEEICTEAQGTAVAGTYSISASGFGFIINPVTGDKVYGLVSANGVFVGSSTEATDAYNDLMIVVGPNPSPLPGNSFFNGSYSVAGFFPGGSPLSSEDAFFQMNANGAGKPGHHQRKRICRG